ncbi:NmrA family protein [Beutenbergia cavernae DSM 12333]|uniref:NmrA family protein n=1 Tax=Beutenbergia cavernae (strain ATCC BAA-8 / DSM 12333 / CCUG 43141 / JCM 11478 / NBRC 16432 / NCIMB 13614 / HKI 0122) TaxID=471853 RepID=C5C0E5_BEUC1|nr:NAD(P)H-binding protein [Beutenbergia cavernae]ACQ79331.1 NmrA family protein [Beutenbergia cavernae DSM 12333]
MSGAVAVTGATGTIGSAVAATLAAEGHDVVALVRDPARFAAPPGRVRVAVAEYDDRDALVRALDGVATLVFVASDGEVGPMLVHHLNVVEAAARSGVAHVVYLSIVDVDPSSPFCYAAPHAATERLLADAGLVTTAVRAGMYGEFFVRFLREAATTGRLALPMEDGVLSLVSRADVARCLAAAASSAPNGPHLVTGDRTYDLGGLAAVASRRGRQVRAEPVDARDFGIALLRGGLEPWWTYAFTSMFAAVAENRFAGVTTGVVDLTGRGPVSFEQTADEVLRRVPDLPST